jgi:hypothetical protein
MSRPDVDLRRVAIRCEEASRSARGGERHVARSGLAMMRQAFLQPQLEEICAGVLPADDHVALLAEVNALAGDTPFRHALTRTGWHRSGGVVAATGARIANNLRQWAEDESEGDMFALYEAYADKDLVTTRFDGKTHYLVAPFGERACDFVQLEVEELVETVDHPLFVNDLVPDDIEDLLDPADALEARLTPRYLGEPRYAFHAVTDIAGLIAGHAETNGSDRRYIRLLKEWDATSAGAEHRFCDHFVLRLLPFLDRFGEHKTEATPLPIDAVAELDAEAINLKGAALANFLHAFCAKAGFPMAWYFLMLIRKGPMVGLAQNAYLDCQRDYRYLADKDFAVLEEWMRKPYSF